MKLEELKKWQVVDIFNALLTDGADNTNMTIIHANEGTKCRDLCGYGDDDETLTKGTYLLVWDFLDEGEHMWPSLYKIVNSSIFPYEAFDILFPIEDKDAQCVIIFKLTDL